MRSEFFNLQRRQPAAERSEPQQIAAHELERTHRPAREQHQEAVELGVVLKVRFWEGANRLVVGDFLHHADRGADVQEVRGDHKRHARQEQPVESLCRRLVDLVVALRIFEVQSKLTDTSKQ